MVVADDVGNFPAAVRSVYSRPRAEDFVPRGRGWRRLVTLQPFFSRRDRLWNVLGEMRVCKGVLAKSRLVILSFVLGRRLLTLSLSIRLGSGMAGINNLACTHSLRSLGGGAGAASPTAFNLSFLQSSPKVRSIVRRSRSLTPGMKLAVDRLQSRMVHVCVDLRRGHVAVTEQLLHDTQVGPAAKQMRCKAVSQHVRPGLF